MSWDKFEKLVSLVKQKVATIVLFRLKDPRVGFVTVTKIVLTRDLKKCTVHYSVLGTSGEKSRTAKALEDADVRLQDHPGEGLQRRRVDLQPPLPVLNSDFDHRPFSRRSFPRLGP